MKFFDKKKGNPPALVALLGDLHLNSTMALPPGRTWPLDDGGTYQATRTQLWILDAWHHFWQFIDAKRKAHKADLFIILNGDLVDGDHHDTNQIISRIPGKWGAMAAKVLDPIVKRTDPEKLFIIRGTEAHGGRSGSSDEGIAKDFGAHPSRYTREREVAAYSHDRLYLEVQGVRFDIKHSTTRGKDPRGKNTSAIRLASKIQTIYTDRGEPVPHLVVRSHVHVSEDSDKAHWTRCIILPCWQGPTAFGYKIADDLPDIGAGWALCQDGQYEADVIKYPAQEEFIEWIKY